MTDKQPIITMPHIRFMQALQTAQDCQCQDIKVLIGTLSYMLAYVVLGTVLVLLLLDLLL